MSPLADPVVNTIFANAELAGLAAYSLINAILQSDGSALTGTVVRVTPQQTHSFPYGRGCRVDVEVLTDTNELIIFEVQLRPDKHIMTRSLFSTSHVIINATATGDAPPEMAKKIPRIINIHIL
jgi:hypothetical protein